jgi:5-formyltetrahydrofolate cyclo-ligase
MTPIKRIKDEIRADFSAKRDALDPEVRHQRSKKICETAKALVSFRHAEIILLYFPIKSEIDILPLFYYALENGKKVAFPKCDKEDRTMKFHFVKSLDQLEKGAYGIMEPKEECEVYDPENHSGVAVCYVPGLAFDVGGYRLGYGKGYYDKFMYKFNGSTIGVIYDEFILPSLPRGRFDLHCDIMITQSGVKTIK